MNRSRNGIAPEPPAPTPGWLRFVELMRGYWSPLLEGIGLSILSAAFVALPPYLSKVFVDRAYVTGDVALSNVLIIGIAAAQIMSAVTGALRSYFVGSTLFRLSSAITLLFFNHLQHLPIKFFESHRVGEINSRFQDVRSALSSVIRIVEIGLSNGALLLFAPPLLLLLQWKLALVTIPALCAPGLVIAITSGRMRRLYSTSTKAQAELAAYLVEVLSHIRSFKAMNLERELFERAGSEVGHARVAQTRALAFAEGLGMTYAAARAIGWAVFLWVAWSLLIRGELTLGGYVAFSMYLGLLQGPVAQLISAWQEYQHTSVVLGRMFEYLDEAPEQEPRDVYREAKAKSYRRLRGDIQLDGVTYRHVPDQKALDEVSVNFPAMGMTAIVGASGAGKSTLLNILLRLYQPDEGSITIDGTPLAHVPIRDLRHQIAIVWQDVALVRGTLWDNLTLGAANPTREAVAEAVRLCSLQQVVNERRHGYETPVSEWGASLSGGERQRIALARAVIRNTPILILDEATANIDVRTEQELLRNLRAHYYQRTVLFVTHRVLTARLADQICVLDKGRVSGVGPHQALVRHCDVYRRLLAIAGETEARSPFQPSAPNLLYEERGAP